MKYPNFWHKPLLCEQYQQINLELEEHCRDRTEKLISKGIGFEHLDRNAFEQAVPALRPWLDSYNIGPIKNIALVVIGPHKNQKIHTDAQQMDLALNFGIQVNGTHTNMYRITSGTPTTVPYGDQGLVFHSYEHCILENETLFTLYENPILFNTKHVHRVINPTNQPRIAISLRFVKDPDHLL